MSSMRNAIQRRNHRERAQPTERAKWGLLEKRKDYQLRAADHKTKQRRLKSLQEKARDRNEDEFYFGMMSSRSEGGVKVAKRGEENGGSRVDPDVLRLMKTQDVAYLRTVLQQTKRERERLEEDTVIAEVGVDVKPTGQGKKVVFGEDGEMLRNVPVQSEVHTDEEDDDGDESEEDGLDASALDKRRAHVRKRRQLQDLKERERKLGLALQKLEDQQAQSNGTAGGFTKGGFRFKARRKR